MIAFDPQHKEHESIRWALREKLVSFIPLECAIEIKMVFVMPIPKSTSKKKREKMVVGETKHTKKSDLDNLIKNLFDCMNGIVFVDDKQVFKLDAVKVYGEEPRTEITVRWNP